MCYKHDRDQKWDHIIQYNYAGTLIAVAQWLRFWTTDIAPYPTEYMEHFADPVTTLKLKAPLNLRMLLKCVSGAACVAASCTKA